MAPKIGEAEEALVRPNPEDTVLQQPQSVVINIESHQQLATLMNNIIFPEENEMAFSQLRRLFSTSARIEWSKPLCDFFPHLSLKSFNRANEELHGFQGPQECDYLGIRSHILPITFEGTEVFSFTYKSVVCNPCCGTKLQAVEVFIPERSEPIGKVEYMGREFSDDKVTITNYLTREILVARAIKNTRLPQMEVKNSVGDTITVAGVTYATVYRGVMTYRKANVYFPTMGISVTTKALLMAFGTVWFMDHHQHNWRISLYVMTILFILAMGFYVFLSFSA